MRSPANRLCLCLLATTMWLPLRPAQAADGPARLVQVPVAPIGEVREIFVKRVQKKVKDVLNFGGRIKVMTDSDRPPKHLIAKKPAKKPSKAQVKLTEADRLRLEGMDLATNKKHRKAYKKFAAALKIYEQYFYELVDYNNMADAYARAGVAAFHAGQKKGNVKFLFTSGIVIQPTLVIDRRKAPPELLSLFDKLHDVVKKSKTYAVNLVPKGNVEGAIVYVDGKRAGPLPTRRGGLRNGYHYVAIKSPNHKPWGKQVRIRGKDVKVKVKLKPLKKKKAGPPPRDLTFADLGWCKNTGNYHDKKCRTLSNKMAKQTGSKWLLFSALKADRYGRLSFHGFLYSAEYSKLVSLPAVELGKNLRNLNANMPGLEEQVSTRVARFPKKRALKKRPRVFD